MFNSALGDVVYGKDDYSPCHKVHYELPCPEGAVVIVQELQLAAGDSLVIDGVTLTGPTTIDLPKVFFLPPEDMNFTFTSDCYNQSRGFRIMYTCMSEWCGEGRGGEERRGEGRGRGRGGEGGGEGLASIEGQLMYFRVLPFTCR